MSSCLSGVMSCNLRTEQFGDLPRVLQRLSRSYAEGDWTWFALSDSSEVSPEHLLTMVEEKFTWLEGPEFWTVVPLNQQITVSYGLAFSRLFSDDPNVQMYLSFCIDLAVQMNSNVIYFVSDSIADTMNYQEIQIRIQCGDLTATTIDNRLKEYRKHCDHDVYFKRL